jgi:hypothetical protein
MGNHIVVLEKNGEEEGANEIRFEELDFDDPAFEAFQVMTERSLYRCVISDSHMDLREPDQKRADLKVVGGKK